MVSKNDIKGVVNLYNDNGEDWLFKVSQNAYNFILKQTSFMHIDHNFRERVFAIKNDIKGRPVCECGKPTHINNDTVITSFRKFCSVECASKYNGENLKNFQQNREDHTKSNIKRKQTMLGKYGTETNSQRQEVKLIISEAQKKRWWGINPNLKLLRDKDWLYNEYFTKYRSGVDIAKELNVNHSTVMEWIRYWGWECRDVSDYEIPQKSKAELEIKKFLNNYGFNFISTRKLIKNHNNNNAELDGYEPKIKFAYEYNGLAYHGTDMEELMSLPLSVIKNRHLYKTIECEKLGIRLVHIWEDEWIDPIKKEIWKSILLSKLGVFNTRIGARKTEIRQILGNSIRQKFYNENHLQGDCGGGISYGLYYNNELMAMMTYGKTRFRSKNEDENMLELYRFATKINTQIIGGFSKLFKHINLPMITFADRRYSQGKIYEKYGEFIHYTRPSYVWVNRSRQIRLKRYSTKKAMLPKLLGDKFDPELSEFKNMLSNGYEIMFDCGNIKYKLDPNKK